MADYTTSARAIALLPSENRVDESTTDPTLEELDLWVTQVSDAVSVAIVNGGGAVPFTDTVFASWLDLLCAKECAFLVMQVKGAAAEKASLWQEYHKEYQDALKAMTKGEVLPEAGTTAAGPGSIVSYTMDAESSTDASLQPIFTTDKQY